MLQFLGAGTALDGALFFLRNIAIIVSIIFMIWLMFAVRLKYKQTKFLKGEKWVTLEIQMAPEIYRSPEAMEVVFQIMSQGFPGKWWQRFSGIVRAWFCLEIASFGGEIHYYIRTTEFFRELLQAQIYSQYPEVKIIEVDDYTHNIRPYAPGSDMGTWGIEYGLKKENPYPIATYVDYKLHETTTSVDENQRLDPMTPLIEFLGSLESHEQVWLQFLIMKPKASYKKPGSWFGKESWDEEVAVVKDKLISKHDSVTKDKDGNEIKSRGLLNMTQGERALVEAVERKPNKLAFDTGIRAVYIFKESEMRPQVTVKLLGLFAPYEGANEITSKFFSDPEYPFYDFFGTRTKQMRKLVYKRYVNKEWFYYPFYDQFKTPSSVLNVEELASLWHFVGGVSETPSLTRIGSKKAEPPSNLPI